MNDKLKHCFDEGCLVLVSEWHVLTKNEVDAQLWPTMARIWNRSMCFALNNIKQGIDFQLMNPQSSDKFTYTIYHNSSFKVSVINPSPFWDISNWWRTDQAMAFTWPFIVRQLDNIMCSEYIIQWVELFTFMVNFRRIEGGNVAYNKMSKFIVFRP